jgi:long-chain acyl-CoA synthetase
LVATGSYNPNPTDDSEPARGEVWARGDNIMKGYYLQPEVTKENLTDDGWLMTGDIGEWQRDGTLKIIDRKKNLVKLSHGEYVALEKMESQYKTSAFVQNMCIHADPIESHIIAIIHPVEKELVLAAKSLGINEPFERLCQNTKVVQAVAQDMLAIARSSGFKSAEILKTFVLVADEWTPENGMLTSAQKLKRKAIIEHYASQVSSMYGRK